MDGTLKHYNTLAWEYLNTEAPWSRTRAPKQRLKIPARSKDATSPLPNIIVEVHYSGLYIIVEVQRTGPSFFTFCPEIN